MTRLTVKNLSLFALVAFVCLPGAFAMDLKEKLLGRWELPDGTSPLVFYKDGTCEVGFGSPKDGQTPMIKGVYRISNEGKITLEVRNSEARLTEHYSFEGDRLTNGVVYGGTPTRAPERKYWRKVKTEPSVGA